MKMYRRILGAEQISRSQQEIPMAMKSPAFTFDYFPSVDYFTLVHRSSHTDSMPQTPLSTLASSAYGSYSSSNGGVGHEHSDIMPSASATSFGKSDEIPMSRFSASPEKGVFRKHASGSVHAFSRSLSIPASPPTPRKMSPVGSGHYVTWGATTTINTSSTIEDEKSDVQESIKPSLCVKMVNPDQFDDENSTENFPLLDTAKRDRYHRFREYYAAQLDMWGLHRQRLEILKFNGLDAKKKKSSLGEKLNSAEHKSDRRSSLS
jgi:hypothetical protein